MERRALKIEEKGLQAWSRADLGSGAWCVTFWLHDVGLII